MKKIITANVHGNIYTKADLFFIASVWLISLVIVNPFGDFPLNDDWSFGLTVKHFLESGDFRPTGWTSMPLITHVLWGSIFCIPGGFSFDALRFSTITMSLAGILGSYILIRELKGTRWMAVVIALTVAFNPIYYVLSNTFMTDVPFTAILILATVFLARCLRSDSNVDLLVGSILVLAATLNRQLGIAVPLAFAFSFILTKGFTGKTMVRALVPAVASIGGLLVFEKWLAATDRLPLLYNMQKDALINALTNPETLSYLFQNVFITLLYLGWFLLPVLVFTVGIVWFNRRGGPAIRRKLISALIAVVLLGLVLWHQPQSLMPLAGNIIISAGVGPLTLPDTFFFHAPHVATLPTGIWLAITGLSLLGGALLITLPGMTVIRLVPKLWPGRINSKQAVSIFLLGSVLIYLFPILIQGFFDRYLAPVVPLLAAGIVSLFADDQDRPRGAGEKLLPIAASTLIGLFFIFSVFATRDYLSWNRARWVILEDLLKNEQVGVEDIDGGFEFNGLHLYDPKYQPKPDRSWWWVDENTFIVAFGSMRGYSVVRELKYRQWLPPHSGSVVLLRKDAGDNTPP